MDTITHGFIGTSCAQMLFWSRLKRYSTWIGLVAAMIPDLDLLLYAHNDPLYTLLMHRTFTHSLVMVPVAALLVTLGFVWWRPFLRACWGWVFLAACVAYLSHIVVDVCTAYGTVMFWPFSDKRVALYFLPILNAPITLLFFGGALMTHVFEKKRYVYLMSALGLLYILFGYVQFMRASAFQEELIKLRHHQVTQRIVEPPFLYSDFWRWQSVYRAGKFIYIDGIATNQAIKCVPGLHYRFRAETGLLKQVRAYPGASHDYARLFWFTQGFMIRLHEQPLTLADARYVFMYTNPLVLKAMLIATFATTGLTIGSGELVGEGVEVTAC